jgi:hypothetical protein
MEDTVMKKSVIAVLILAILLIPSSQQIELESAHGLLGPLTGTLVSVYDPNIPLQTFKNNGVEWVISYDFVPPSSLITGVHNLGMKLMVYVTALKEPGSYMSGIPMPDGTTVTPAQSWAQYVYPSGPYLYPDSVGGELWFSPYGPYVDQVTIPRAKYYLGLGADGIFLDTLILYGDAIVGVICKILV